MRLNDYFVRYTLPHRRKVTRTEDNVFWSAREHQVGDKME